MLKFLSAFVVIVFAASTLMAQEISLPAPSGPGDVPPPPKSQKPVPPPPGQPGSQPSNGGALDPFPNQPSQPAANDPVVYTLGFAKTLRSGDKDFVFTPDQGYNRFEVVGVVSTTGNIVVNSVRITYRDGRPSEALYGLADSYHANQGRIALMMAPNVANVIVNARNANGSSNPGEFRVDVKATKSGY